MNLKKDEFIEIIEEVKSSTKYQEQLNSFIKNSGSTGVLEVPNCSQSVMRLLKVLYEEQDKYNVISFFCNDLKFGTYLSGKKDNKDKKQNFIKKKLGIDIKLDNAEDLYNYLCEQD